jgi:nicotinamide-nucleotide adenylyltransferase
MIGLRIARIQPPHLGHLDAIQQAFSHGMKKLIIGIGSADKYNTAQNPFSENERQHMIQTLIDKHNLSDYTQIYHLPDFPEDTQWIQHITNTLPTWSHVISDNPQVTDLFPDRHIIQPKNRIIIRASDIRQAIREQNHTVIQQFLAPEVIAYLEQIDAYERIKSLNQ